jgi:23S rRNA (cytosine1962-C5)-methyltransferase
VDVQDWTERMARSAQKAGRPITNLEILPPDADFPSTDGRHPLKVAIIEA